MTTGANDKDILLTFPHFTVLKASAGSGKTYALTRRFVQFLLSETIPNNRLPNILAITFSNNAAKEMRERILWWLKSLSLGNQDMISDISRSVFVKTETIQDKALRIIGELIDHYADFQVRTIDSFMATIFKGAAIDFGYDPDFEILLDNEDIIRHSFDLFLRDVSEGTEDAQLLEEALHLIIEHKSADASYPWDPSDIFLSELQRLYRKLSSIGKKPRLTDYSDEMESIKRAVCSTFEDIEQLITRSGLDRNKGSSYANAHDLVKQGRFNDLIGKGLKKTPVNKPKKNHPESQRTYEAIQEGWNSAVALINRYITCYAHSCFLPYLRVFERFSGRLEEVKKRLGKVFIEDINRELSEYLTGSVVPDVYFRLGESVSHFLIDEFQDTSPIQWKNLLPLIENTLSVGGSLFVVGDTKQAIYWFRDTDYRIMKKLESFNPFPSAHHAVHELDVNYRSLPKILEFSEKVFKKIIPAHNTYREPAERSGLTSYIQRPRHNQAHPGYAEVVSLQKNPEDPLERHNVQNLCNDLIQRGFQYRDIAILTQKNEDVVKTSTWLNETGIPFISYSSLDVRRRKITGEIIALLSFLDSPPDDLSFATFILGQIFDSTLTASGTAVQSETLRRFLFDNREKRPLYKAFQSAFPELWTRFFERLFRATGYLPPYDLITEAFGMFALFETMSQEEATLVKILETAKDLEGKGYNSLRDFLNFAADAGASEGMWDISVPRDFNAVRVMTIHKAKGLGFPAVIVLLYDEPQKGFDYIVREDDSEVSLLKITGKIAECDPSLEALYHEERVNDQVNKLNSLYVGFTRAEEELYVINIRGREDYPHAVIPADVFAPSVRPDRTHPAALVAPHHIAALHLQRGAEIAVASDEPMPGQEKQRGEFIHKVLSRIHFWNAQEDGQDDRLFEIIRLVRQEMRIEHPDADIRQTLLRLFANPEISVFFRRISNRVVKTEQECTDALGRLFRVDRLILDPDAVTVVDFKTGREQVTEKHLAQMKTYLKIFRDIYPGRSVGGFIVYLDLDIVKGVA